MNRRVAAAGVLLYALALAQLSCGGSPGAGQSPAAQPPPVVCSNDTMRTCSSSADCAPPGFCLDARLSGPEVRAIMESAGRALDPSQYEIAVAVTDRRGVILGVGTNFAIDYPVSCSVGCPATDREPGSDPFTVDLAVQLARTASFFSADQTPLTSRSVRFLSGEHFPPGVQNTAAAALFGIENTNRGCDFDALDRPLAESIPRALNLCAVLAQRSALTPIDCESSADPAAQCGCTRGILTLPGAVPIYRYGHMAGGVGVAIRGVVPEPDPIAAYPPGSGILRYADNQPQFSTAEFAARAYAGDNTGLPDIVPHGLKAICDNPNVVRPPCCDVPPDAGPRCSLDILPGRALPFDPVIFVDGIEIPEVLSNPVVSAGAGTFGRCSVSLASCRVDAPDCPSGETCAAITTYIVDPDSLRPDDPLESSQPVPDGWLIAPRDSSPGAEPLSATEVETIIDAGIQQADAIRAAIRLPLAARTKMMLAVSDTNGVLLGLYRMPDATVFSIDVAVAKSRNVIYFSSADIDPLDTMDCPGVGDCRGEAFPPGTAITNRTLSFGAQPYFPSGIPGNLPGFPNGLEPGPFRSTFIYDSNNPCTNGLQPRNGRQNNIVFFPGSTPIYRDDVLVGGFGISGDGVEQDDIVTVSGARASTGAQGFLPDSRIRADRIFVRGVRLPFVKFNRRPEQ